MTSQLLIPSPPSKVSDSSMAPRQSEVISKTAVSPSSSTSAVSMTDTKLPYQVDHQVELLHLRAEAEALLQELQTLKQRRLVTSSSEN